MDVQQGWSEKLVAHSNLLKPSSQTLPPDSLEMEKVIGPLKG